jgi:hypothetical protein
MKQIQYLQAKFQKCKHVEKQTPEASYESGRIPIEPEVRVWWHPTKSIDLMLDQPLSKFPQIQVEKRHAGTPNLSRV